ncbi:MAG: hypothetical protein KIT81_08300 [Alphaproteobacteria bacterium]|nr:hypothetical protein [Alphaproteobacteria bacterium]
MAFTDIDTDALFSAMFGAARREAGDAWPELRGICKIELKAIARQIKEVGKSVSVQDVTPEAGRAILRLSRANSGMVLAAMTPQTIATIDRVMGSALAEVREPVRAAMGFDLL